MQIRIYCMLLIEVYCKLVLKLSHHILWAHCHVWSNKGSWTNWGVQTQLVAIKITTLCVHKYFNLEFIWTTKHTHVYESALRTSWTVYLFVDKTFEQSNLLTLTSVFHGLAAHDFSVHVSLSYSQVCRCHKTNPVLQSYVNCTLW